ncbi:MAG TPA: serine hydrolase [Ktedonobacterales bacterium]|nr:serine hydrolase [Ktedonobacterales bacterium]
MTDAAVLTDTTPYPGQEWKPVAAPEALGWSGERLSRAWDYAESIGSLAVMVVTKGSALARWGEVERPFNCRSIRKSLLSSLYGIHVGEGHLALASTLADLGIDDTEPALSEEEKQATVEDLLVSRSGVYHPSNYQPLADRARLPARGSHAPGTFWYYNNWDFNALGTIFERCTQTRIFEEFERRIAQPLQMQDYRVEEMRYGYQEHSIHPVYSFRISARDLARYGLLYLRRGRWRARQVVPGAWVETSTRTHALTHSQTGAGFGYLWWTCINGNLFHGLPLPEGSYASYGMGGQFLLVIPARDLVVVHMGNPDDPAYRQPTTAQLCRLMELILEASGG